MWSSQDVNSANVRSYSLVIYLHFFYQKLEKIKGKSLSVVYKNENKKYRVLKKGYKYKPKYHCYYSLHLDEIIMLFSLQNHFYMTCVATYQDTFYHNVERQHPDIFQSLKLKLDFAIALAVFYYLSLIYTV